MLKSPQAPAPLATINVFVTREISFDLERMNRVTAAVLKRLGCENCHSGHILNYHSLQDFIVNPKTLEIDELLPGSLRR